MSAQETSADTTGQRPPEIRFYGWAPPKATTRTTPEPVSVPPAPTATTVDKEQAKTSSAQTPKPDRPVPTMGWQAVAWGMTKRFKNATPPKLSRKEQRILRRKASTEQLKRDSADVKRPVIAVIGIKGAAATTTVTAYASSVHADLTRRSITGVDFNSAQGMLGARLGKRHGQTGTVQSVLEGSTTDDSFTDVIHPLAPTKYGVRVIAANNIIRRSDHLTDEGAQQVVDVASVNAEVLYFDTANDITTGVMLQVLQNVDVFVFTAYVQVRSSLRMLADSMETLRQHGFAAKVANSVVVISGLGPKENVESYRMFTDLVDTDDTTVLEKLDYNGTMMGIPYDPAIRLDGEVDLEALKWETYQAFLELLLAIYQKARLTRVPATSS